jgi:hypothetical protein
MTMDESWGNGLSFHPLHYYDGRGAALVMYYHGGTYDPFSGLSPPTASPLATDPTGGSR